MPFGLIKASSIFQSLASTLLENYGQYFSLIIIRYKRIGYNQSVFLVFNAIMVDNYPSFFNCNPAGRSSDSMMASI